MCIILGRYLRQPAAILILIHSQSQFTRFQSWFSELLCKRAVWDSSLRGHCLKWLGGYGSFEFGALISAKSGSWSQKLIHECHWNSTMHCGRMNLSHSRISNQAQRGYSCLASTEGRIRRSWWPAVEALNDGHGQVLKLPRRPACFPFFWLRIQRLFKSLDFKMNWFYLGQGFMLILPHFQLHLIQVQGHTHMNLGSKLSNTWRFLPLIPIFIFGF